MNIALWVVQGVLAIAFLGAGGMKAMSTKAKLTANPHMGWTNDFTEVQIKLIGLAEVVGAVGLIVPWALGIAPILTPIAAACLALLMIGAVRAHVLRKEPTIPPIVLGALSAFVSIGRFMQL